MRGGESTFRSAVVLVGDIWPKAVAGLCGGGAMRVVKVGFAACLLGDCVCDRSGGTKPCCFVGSTPLGGDIVLTAAWEKEAAYGTEDDKACWTPGLCCSSVLSADFRC